MLSGGNAGSLDLPFQPVEVGVVGGEAGEGGQLALRFLVVLLAGQGEQFLVGTFGLLLPLGHFCQAPSDAARRPRRLPPGTTGGRRR